MVLTVLLSIVAIVLMFICVLKFPVLKIGKYKFESFYIPLTIVALIFLIFPIFDKSEFFSILFSSSALNPLKILILFICVSVLSIFLDETGFFGYIATVFIKKYKDSQFKLFATLYVIVSILTVFTSNDIIILTFTPFIIHFSKKGNINPIPYLVMQFVAANTWSMALSIGNPTNIYLSSIFDIGFFDYFLKMVLPAVLCGIASFITLFLLFRKTLKKKIEVFDLEETKINNKFLCFTSLIHLSVTIVLLALSNYVNLEMYIICLIFSVSLLMFFLFYSIKNKDYKYVNSGLKRIPYSLIPFILSMFTIIMALDSYGVFESVYNALSIVSNESLQPIIYLVTSTLSCNVVNNIPMSLAYGSILSNSSNIDLVYASIIGSNLGALLTPIGALAGIMWIRMIKDAEVKYNFVDFMKNGSILTLVLMITASISLLII